MNIYYVSYSNYGLAPKKAYKTDAGFDLYSAENYILKPGERKVISLDINMAIPKGYYGEIVDRSGNALKNGIHVLAGTIDSEYRGTVKVVLLNTNNILNRLLRRNYFKIQRGDRIAQLIIHKVEDVEFIEAGELPESERNINGFGSTGK